MSDTALAAAAKVPARSPLRRGAQTMGLSTQTGVIYFATALLHDAPKMVFDTQQALADFMR